MIQMCPKVLDLYYASLQRVKHNKIKSYGGKKKTGGFFIYDTFHEHSNQHDGEMLAFVGDFVPETITGIFTYNKCSSYQRDDVSPWFKFMSDLLSSFWQISLITKSGPTQSPRWQNPMSPMNGHWGPISWATHGLPMMWSMGTCNKLPRGDHIFGPNAHLGQHGANVRLPPLS